MKSINISICFVLVWLATIPLQAQVSGFRGKRFFIYTDAAKPLLERGYGIGIGWVRSRRHTVTLTYDNGGRSTSAFNHRDREVEVPIRYRFQSLELALNKYYRNAIPAPKGFYRTMAYKLGNGWFSVDDPYLRIDPITGQRFLGPNTYRLDNIQRHELKWGYGYFYVFGSGLFIDASSDFNIGWLDPGQFGSLTQDYSNSIGPNLYRIPFDVDDLYISLGFSARFKVGIMF